ncbi:DeoR/GlpR family DNA-binding transcription regulator [Paenibacillus chibensis]|uniref:DeoR/GlpR family DNA-binding transcription regulator n=1 Tax=Paenibacillus chibensis TaxID=59846 RepID=UPI000FDA2BBD|nr:DeoR/GlpR family DNA-binding transcription regulator [Paenibacillus chibensis]MEC0372213.1 DeoR/GlpR family DNA-binding transcription regulator [Paenibacillus chibensis]
MFQEERLHAIQEHLNRHKRIDIKDICQLFEVSRDTARRDLLKMEELGRITRTHGGAVLPKKDIFVYSERLERESSVKRRIGKFAASLVQPGDSMMMDASTTVQFAAESLTSHSLVVVTNSIDIAGVVSHKESVQTYLLGGELHPQHRFLHGQVTINMLNDYKVDKLFLSSCGISNSCLSSPLVEEGEVKRAMLKRANQVIVLVDHTKFGDQMLYQVAGLDCIDLLITDEKPSEDMMRKLEQHQVELLVAAEDKCD